MPRAAAAAEPIDVSYDDGTRAERFDSLSRESLMRAARSLAAAITGQAAIIEGAADRIRPEFVGRWREWCGLWLSFYFGLERGLPMNLRAAQDVVDSWQRTLAVWREGLRYEVDLAAPAVAAAAAPTRPWPWWAKTSIALGLGYGAYKIVQLIVESWVSNPSITVGENEKSSTE